mmetsp:Transcript_10641/g.34998  ORF Transcript_10641/g.34998 Transcript_10641/m.34998 type:complete len:288 (-) Transcript_10641:1255-2118(-)
MRKPPCDAGTTTRKIGHASACRGLRMTESRELCGRPAVFRLRRPSSHGRCLIPCRQSCISLLWSDNRFMSDGCSERKLARTPASASWLVSSPLSSETAAALSCCCVETFTVRSSSSRFVPASSARKRSFSSNVAMCMQRGTTSSTMAREPEECSTFDFFSSNMGLLTSIIASSPSGAADSLLLVNVTLLVILVRSVASGSARAISVLSPEKNVRRIHAVVRFVTPRPSSSIVEIRLNLLWVLQPIFDCVTHRTVNCGTSSRRLVPNDSDATASLCWSSHGALNLSRS